jgi:hypothetical protein
VVAVSVRASAGRGPGRRQGAEVTGALAPDQADGHRQDGEREECARARRDRDRRREGSPFSAELEREAGVRRDLAGGRDLVGRQRPTGLDEPGGRPTSNRNGAGLVGLAERAGHLEGTLRAGARPEGGFRVRLTVPLRAA